MTDLSNPTQSDKAEISTVVVGWIASLPIDTQELVQIKQDEWQRLYAALTAREERIKEEALKVGELHGLGYYNDAFHDLPAPDLEKWYLNQRDRLDEEIAGFTSHGKEKTE